MSLAQRIREAVQAAQAASEPRPDNPFKKVLDEVVEGLTDENVHARLTFAPAGRCTLRLAPAHQPAESVAMLDVMISDRGAELLLDPRQVATTPEELEDILTKLVQTGPFLESLQELEALAKQPVEAFLRRVPRTPSPEDLILEVPAEVQRKIAEKVNDEVSLRLRIARFPGAGIFENGTRYRVLESSGFSVVLSQEVMQEPGGELRIVGHVRPPDVP